MVFAPRRLALPALSSLALILAVAPCLAKGEGAAAPAAGRLASARTALPASARTALPASATAVPGRAVVKPDADQEVAALERRLKLEDLREKLRLRKLEATARRLQVEARIAAAKRALELKRLEGAAERFAAGNAMLKNQALKAKAELELEHSRRQLAEAKTLRAVRVAAARKKASQSVATPVVYSKQPFKAGVLTVTDRRVSLNGPITHELADEVTRRLAFYNNQGAQPVFLVIDRSPGGSVMAGYRILKAMQASRAPVHVLVKSYAASMAAVLTTLAPHSYVYPNAVVLHHQMWTLAIGNATQLKEQLDEMKEWSRRLLGPVAKKLRTTEAAFVKAMYAHDSGGNWAEFGDAAQRLGWVDHVVREVRELGVDRLDDGEPVTPKARKLKLQKVGLEEFRDAQGRRRHRLPQLGAYDAWFLHDPTGRYVP